MDFDVDEPKLVKLESSEVPSIGEELLKLKEEHYVVPKEDIFGMLFKSSEEGVQTVLEVTYYYQKWHEYATNITESMADSLIQEYEKMLKEYSLKIAEKYQEHLKLLIDEQTNIKEKVSAQLSDDELKLQNDNDWLVAFQDQLRIIESG